MKHIHQKISSAFTNACTFRPKEIHQYIFLGLLLLLLILPVLVMSFNTDVQRFVKAFQSGDVWQWQSIPGSFPTPVAGLTDVTAVSAGQTHSLALKADGTVWAWGDNSVGQLGNDTAGTYSATPVQVKGPGGQGYLTGVSAIAAGYNNYSLAIKDGHVYVWGNNQQGWRGTGIGIGDNNSTLPFPTIVKDSQGNDFSGVISISGGENHILAITTDNSVYGWGDNSFGQLGLGDCVTTSCNVEYYPTKIPTLSNITGIAAGFWHSIAVDTNGVVYG